MKEPVAVARQLRKIAPILVELAEILETYEARRRLLAEEKDGKTK